MKTVDIILNKLKREGSVTAKKLSVDLKMTTMAVRQHLQGLEEEGLINFHDVKVKVGRPTRNWTLTSVGHSKFANRHGELTINFIDSVQDLFGEEGLQKVIDRREEQALKHYQSHLTDSHTLAQKLQTLTRLREQEGYMAELEKTEKGYRLLENHCPICHAAKRCPSLCQSEITVFQKLLGQQHLIERVEHIIQGQRRCVYHITEAK